MTNMSVSNTAVKNIVPAPIMLQTIDGDSYYLDIDAPAVQSAIQPLGYRKLTTKPCSECDHVGRYKNAYGVSYVLFKGRGNDWLCTACAKSQRII